MQQSLNLTRDRSYSSSIDVNADQPLNLSKSTSAPSRNGYSTGDSSPRSDCRPDSNQPCKTLIQELIDNDSLEELIYLKNLDVTQSGDPCQRLENIGDEIVEKLVDWTKKLPIYKDLPVDTYSQLLTKQWAEIILLSTAFYLCENDCTLDNDSNIDKEAKFSFVDDAANVRLLCKRLSSFMKRTVPLEYIEREAGVLVASFTSLVNSLKKLKLSRDAYVCLKAITLLHQGKRKMR